MTDKELLRLREINHDLQHQLDAEHAAREKAEAALAARSWHSIETIPHEDGQYLVWMPDKQSYGIARHWEGVPFVNDQLASEAPRVSHWARLQDSPDD